jgi:crotonobetainyl-CoA:carnitine CoA-transferase CaiB-like acyl-CoA transferase
VATWGLVPACGAVLADWGADVLKIEHPVIGDPIRGVSSQGIEPGAGGFHFLWEILNRGKRSVGIDMSTAEGRELILRFAEECDVFLTNLRPAPRRRLGIDVEDVMGRNPRIIYARGSATGPLGPEAELGGWDFLHYWYRSGGASAITPRDRPYPLSLPCPAFGDIQTGMMLAGGISAALVGRESTGEGAVVDVSLLSAGMWAMQSSIVVSRLAGIDELKQPDRGKEIFNPLVNTYRTSDGRYVALCMFYGDRFWPDLCRVMERSDLIDHPIFGSAESRAANIEESVALLDEIFATATFAEWKERLGRQQGEWDVVQRTSELYDDAQSLANGYIQEVDYGNGRSIRLVSAPVQFDETPPSLGPAPDFAVDTDAALLELGLDWDELIKFKEAGVIA